ncbi:hypothetical protein MRB53_037937 [Persea americana]|nr:hypothetical protein MRB53_037937 [Persea americana]
MLREHCARPHVRHDGPSHIRGTGKCLREKNVGGCVVYTLENASRVLLCPCCWTHEHVVQEKGLVWMCASASVPCWLHSIDRVLPPRTMTGCARDVRVASLCANANANGQGLSVSMCGAGGYDRWYWGLGGGRGGGYSSNDVRR